MIGQKGLPAKEGGIERHVEALCLYLKKQGNDLFVYTRPHYTPKTLKDYQGIKLISLPSLRTKHLDTPTHTFLATLHLLFQKIDIAHYHGIGPSLFLWLPRLFRPDIKVIATFHCQDYYHQKWGPFARLCLKLGEKIAVHFAHELIVVSKTLETYIKEKYNILPHYIPNGISLPAKNFSNSKESLAWWGLKPKGYILAVSRLVRHKGLHTLIQAYQQLNHPAKKLVIVGAPAFTENYEKELKELAKGNPHIIFTGQQTGRALALLYQNAYLFVQPSESEGLSLSLLEAISYGIPVLVSDIPANQEVVGKKGLMFKTKSVADLKIKLEKILTLPETLLAQKAVCLKTKVINLYAWKKIGKSTQELYQKAISEKPRILLRFVPKKI